MLVKLLPKWVAQIQDADQLAGLASEMCMQIFRDPTAPHLVRVLSCVAADLVGASGARLRVLTLLQQQLRAPGDIFVRLSPLLVLKVTARRCMFHVCSSL